MNIRKVGNKDGWVHGKDAMVMASEKQRKKTLKKLEISSDRLLEG